MKERNKLSRIMQHALNTPLSIDFACQRAACGVPAVKP